MILSILYNYLPFNNSFSIRKGNQVSLKGNFLKRCKIIVKGKNNSIYFFPLGKNYLEKCNIKIYGDDNSVLISGSHNSLILTEIWMEDNENKVSFGNKTVISGATHLALTEGSDLSFGDGCLLSSDVTFRTGDSHSILSIEGDKRINPSKSIYIGNRVWIGNKTIVLKGSRIQDDSVVATGSVVTKEFNDTNVIIAGNPAVIIKNNVKWIKERVKI